MDAVGTDGRATTEAELRAVFDAPASGTVGLEEEVLLVDAASGAVAPAAAEVVAAAADGRVKPELPACQIELATRPHPGVDDAVAELAGLRRLLAAACPPGVRPCAAALHPWHRGPMPVADTLRARALLADYGTVARRQLVAALQVHVAVGDADVALAVYNALRGHLPELAALAAAAPFHEGEDTGLASARPLVCTQLPRQGVPPAFPSWAAVADALRWGAAAGRLPDAGRWWWELRLHPCFGTLEVRVPDVQPTVAASAAVAAVAAALVHHLADQHRSGRPLDVPDTWRIADNRWSALRDGVEGTLADLRTGEPVPTRRRLLDLLDQIEPHAPGGLDAARALLAHPSARRLRAAGPTGAVPWLVDAFLADVGLDGAGAVGRREGTPAWTS